MSPYPPLSDDVAKSGLRRSGTPFSGMSPSGTSVWTGRALQAGVMIWRLLVLRFCIRPLSGAFALLAIMDIRAHLFSFASRP
jgi:hypothetical protein